MEGYNILHYTGDDYKPVVYFGDWRVGHLNYSERFDPDKIDMLERHMKMDEVFVLLKGRQRYSSVRMQMLATKTANLCIKKLR